MKKYLLLFLLLSSLNSVFAQQPIPASPETKSILLIGATAHIGNGNIIENAAIGIKNGKIILVQDATGTIDKSAFDTIIDVSGKQIYPGFIVPNTTLGLVEIESVRATVDFEDVGNINPDLRTIIAYNTDSKITPTVRMNGVLLAQITPRGGLVSGTSSIVELDGWNWQDAAYKIDDGVHINWPLSYARHPINEDDMSGLEPNKNYLDQIEKLRKFFQDAKAYNQTDEHTEKNLRFAAMKNIFNGTEGLFIHVEAAKDIIESVNFAKEFSIPRIIVVGASDAWRVTDFLKQNNVAVMVERTHSLPYREDDDIDQPYKLPAELQKAGILFCLDNAGDMEAMQSRNLPFLAGTACAYGLTKEQALASITSNTAKILGIDKTVGTLETGKDATLFVSTGDALDMKSNNVELAFIRGKKIQLTSVQTALDKEYMHKYGLK